MTKFPFPQKWPLRSLKYIGVKVDFRLAGQDWRNWFLLITFQNGGVFTKLYNYVDGRYNKWFLNVASLKINNDCFETISLNLVPRLVRDFEKTPEAKAVFRKLVLPRKPTKAEYFTNNIIFISRKRKKNSGIILNDFIQLFW